MKIFITGIESFLGSFLVKYLKKQNINFSGIDLVKKNKFTKKFNINDKNLGKIIPNKCDVVIHLAAVSSSNDFKINAEKAFNINVNGTINVIKSAIKKNVKQIIFASSEWVYGETKTGKKDEKSFINYENLGSEYGLSKIICENILKYYCSVYNINCTILRFGIIYGPRKNRNNWSAVESILLNLFYGNKEITIGSRKTARRFIYAEDIARGILASIGTQGINTFNLSGDKLITLKEIINTGCNILDTKCKIIEKNPKNFNVRNPDNKLIKKLTKWKPKYDFYSGAKKTIESFKNQKF